MIFQKKKPKTIQEAIEMIVSSLSDDDLKFIRDHTPSEMHFTTGMYIRNNWNLWNARSPIVKDFKKRFKLYGHADDVSGIILDGVWATVTGGDVNSRLNDTAERCRQHWLKYGTDPETGERMETRKTIAEKYNWSAINVDFDVEETRKLAASHGKDGLIIIAWTDNGNGTVKYNTTTAGKNRRSAFGAAALRDYLMSFIGGSDNKPVNVEDRINEHTD